MPKENNVMFWYMRSIKISRNCVFLNGNINISKQKDNQTSKRFISINFFLSHTQVYSSDR